MANANEKLIGQGILSGNKRVLEVELDFTEFDDSYKGKFVFHHPTLQDRMNIGIIKSQLLNGMEGKTDVVTDNIAFMTAVLSVVTDQAPAWFKINELYDYEVLNTVYETYNEWVNTFRRNN